MRRAIAAILVALAVALPAFASSFNHFTGTSAPSGFAALVSGNGVLGMNGTLTNGSGGTPTAGITGESWYNGVSAAANDASAAYITTQVAKNVNRIHWFMVRSLQTTQTQIALVNAAGAAGTPPAVDTQANYFGATHRAIARVEIGQNTGANIGVSRWDNANVRTQWETTPGANWNTPTRNASASLNATYQLIGFEIDGTNQRWRVHVIGQTGTGAPPSASFYQAALTDWTTFAFSEGGTSTACATTCDNLWFVIGDPVNDSTAATWVLEWYAMDDGTQVPGWTNGRNAGGTWAIFYNYSYPDTNGLPARWIIDAATPVLTVGGGGAWDESHVKDQYVLQDGGTFVMMYGGSNAGGKFQSGCASASAVTGPWTKCPNNPISVLSAGTNRDQVVNPILIRDDGEPDPNKRYKLFTVGVDTSSPLKFRLYEQHCSALPTAAACDTAAEWGAAVLIWDAGAGGSIDELGCGRGIPVQAGALYMFCGVRALSGGAAQNRQATYATTTDRFLSALTKSGSIVNPSGAALGASCHFKTTAAITTAGSRVLTADSVTGCSVDQFINCDDDGNSANYHHHKIQAINGLLVTVYNNEDSFPIGTVCRGQNAHWQVDAGPIRAYAGGYYQIATTFGPFDEVAASSCPGASDCDAYSETTTMWIASSPLGPWTAYNMGSPANILNAFSRGASNENLSLLNTAFTALSGSSGVAAPPALGAGAPASIPRSIP